MDSGSTAEPAVSQLVITADFVVLEFYLNNEIMFPDPLLESWESPGRISDR